MDIVFIAPGNHKSIYQTLGEDIAAIEPPVWTGMLANATRKSGHEVLIIDQSGEGKTAEVIAQQCSELSPRLVVFVCFGQQPSASTQIMSEAYSICSLVKESCDARTLFVGGHPSSLPQRTLTESGADFVSQGEGFVYDFSPHGIW